MVQSIHFNPQAQSMLMSGLGGFVNGSPVGNQGQNGPQGLLSPRGLGGLAGQSIAQRLGLNANQSPTLAPKRGNDAEESTKSPILEQKEEAEKNKKSDKVELNEFAEEAAKTALENARRSPSNGTTNEVIVSEDGRFEASIDLQINADGSYDMDLEVHFAASKGAMLSQGQQALPQGEGEVNAEGKAANLSYSGLQAMARRNTSFEQILETRDFQARIFFEEAKEVSLMAEEMHGEEAGANFRNVAGQVSQEFVMNIEISGNDINAFNEVGETLAQFDDTGTLSGFLEAARGVLNADSSNLGTFMEATQSLIDASKEHIGAKLNNFFTNMNKQHGENLEKMGFEPNFLETVGQDVQKDLGTFFQATNNFFANFLGGNGNAVEDQSDARTQQMEMLEENMKQMREEQKEVQRQKQEEVMDNYKEKPMNQPTFEGLLA